MWIIRQDTQLWFDIRDEFGNVLAFYSDPTGECNITMRIFEGSKEVYKDNIGKYTHGTLFYGVGKTFTESATFELYIDIGPLGGLGKILISGLLYDEKRLVEFKNVQSENFIIHMPVEYFWNISAQVRDHVFIESLETVYKSMGNYLGENLRAKPHRVEINFEWAGVGGTSFVGFGLGVARWPVHLHHGWLGVISHELGHLYSFTPPLVYYVECPLFGEPLATYLGIEAVSALYGSNVRLWYWGTHPGLFDYISGDKSVSEIERMQFVFFYLHKVYGPEIHKQFIQLWANNTTLKDKLMRKGFSVNETMITLYSYLAEENLARLFQLAGYNVSEDTVQSGLIIFTDTTPPTTTHNYDGLWHTSDITIVLKSSDDLSGVADTFYRINSSPVKRVSVDGQPLISTEGANNTLEYWSVDNAGNEEPHKILTSIKLDKTPPTGSITINSGIKYTNTTKVFLALSSLDATSEVAEMRFSSNNVTWTPWEPFTTVKPWVLEQGDGLKYVYVQFRDHAKLVSQVYYATIMLDAIPPVVNVVGLQTRDTGVTISWSGSDNLSGIDHYEIRLNEGKWINVEASTNYTFENLTQRLHIIYIKAVDRAGNMNASSTQLTITTVTQTTTIPTTTTTTVTSTTTLTQLATVTQTTIVIQTMTVTTTATVSQTKVETYTISYTITHTQPKATETSWISTIVLVVILLLVGILIGYAIRRR
jgi:hypothetical protein